MNRTVIWQKKISKDRIDSFWYDGVIAIKGKYILIACGDIRVQFKGDNEQYRGNHAVEKAWNLGYKDKDLNNKVEEWENNNWFEVIIGTIDAGGIYHIKQDFECDIAYDYDKGIEKLNIYYKEKVGRK